MTTQTRTPQPLTFYVTGGTVPRDAPSYVERQADTTLLEGLRQAQFCYVLTSRQMGKSSLMARTAARLREEGTAVAVLDLTAIGQNLTPEQWYDGLLNLLARALDLEDEMEAFWFARERLSPLQRWMQALREVVLKRVPGPVVIFIDEIDAVRSLPFSADEFFAAIRECYNRRGEEPEYGRLSFCLLGVASPSDLIRDTRTTPFNIGRRVELSDFTVEEAAPLAAGLQEATPSQVVAADLLARLLGRVLYWTGGHPYLTQRLCQAVAEGLEKGEAGSTELVDRLCGELFLSSSAQEQDDNLIFVRERLLRSEADLASLLDLYAQVLRGKRIADDETKSLVNVLKLSGVVAAKNGVLAVRNRIYGGVFDSGWVTEHMPDAELRRQRRAYRRGLLRATVLTFTILLLLGGLIGVWVEYRQSKQEEAMSYNAAIKQSLLNSQLQDERDQTKQAAERAQKEAGRAQQAEKQAKSLYQQADLARRSAEYERGQAFKQERIAQSAATEANKQRSKAVHFENLSKQEYFLMKAHANRMGNQPGWRFDSLAAVSNATKPNPSASLILPLRNEAIADMALPVDLNSNRSLRDWKSHPEDYVFAVDMEHGRYFRGDAHGNIHILRLADGKQLGLLPGYGVTVESANRHSPDNRYRDVKYDDYRHTVWDCLTGKALPEDVFPRERVSEIDFCPDNRRMVMGRSDDKSIRFIDLPTGRESRRFTSSIAPDHIRISPDGRKLAIADGGNKVLHVLNLDTGKEVALPCPSDIDGMVWYPDCRKLAIACGGDHNSYVIDVEGRRLAYTLRGHRNNVISITLSPDGMLLATTSFDNTVKIWNADSGALLISLPRAAARMIGFSADGRFLMGGDLTGSWICEIAESRECRLLEQPGGDFGERVAEFSPDGRLLVSADKQGVEIWDTVEARLLASLPIGECKAVFSLDGKQLITIGPGQFYSWPITTDHTNGVLTIGPPQNRASWIPLRADRFCQSLDGRTLAIVHGESDLIVLSRNSPRPVVLGSQFRMKYIAISPDGRWVATSPWSAPGKVSIWDTYARKFVCDLPVPDFTRLAFSPDGRWLVGGGEAYRFWEVGTWRLRPRTIERAPGSRGPGCMDFSTDGRLLALAYSGTLVQLVDPDTGKEFATLEAPGQIPFVEWLRFSPDGSRLAVIWGDGALRVWDLRLARQWLAKRNLDWDLSSYPPTSKETYTGPLRVEAISPDRSQLERQHYQNQIRVAENRSADLTKQNQAHPNDAKIRNDLATALNNLAWYYANAPEGMRDPARALPLIQQSLHLKPGDAINLNTLGVVYYRLGRYAQAIGTLSDSLKGRDGAFDAWDLFTLSMSYCRLGDRARAQEYYDQAIRWRNGHTDFPPDLIEELNAFQSEAKALLGR